jgi:hypothetical protein
MFEAFFRRCIEGLTYPVFARLTPLPGIDLAGHLELHEGLDGGHPPLWSPHFYNFRRRHQSVTLTIPDHSITPVIHSAFSSFSR